ncbi:MAG: metallophosphatase family protein [Anaerolineae bacterium]|nr:metallophosphatase family protein [Anaerolineae bacterium]
MRCLVLSDIHANFPAFEAVLEDAKKRDLQYDVVWCLGDLVGYGAFPNECIELLQTQPHLCLAGNHDWAVLDKLDISTFHDAAAYVVKWTREHLKPENFAYLNARKEECLIENEDVHLVHASPRAPIWEYISDLYVAEENFGKFSTSLSMHGHTHIPVIFIEDSKQKNVRFKIPEFGVPFMLKAGTRYMINPGGVGQPRDGDPRAAYGLLDTTQRIWTPYRAEYNIKQAQEAMREVGFPRRLVDRLEFGR